MDQHNHERICVAYFVDAHGHILVAPDHRHPTPRGFERREARTLKEVDKLSRILNQQDTSMFSRMWAQDLELMIAQHDRHKTTLRQRLLAVDCGPTERLFIQSAFRYFDQKEEEFKNYKVSGFFHQREFDSPGNDPVDGNISGGKQLVMPKLSDRLALILSSTLSNP